MRKPHQKHWGMARVVKDLTVFRPPTHLSANGMNHVLAFQAEAGPLILPTPEGWKAELT